MAMPKPALMVPITITAGVNDKIDFNRGGVKVASITPGTYYSPSSLAGVVFVALSNADSTPVWSVTVSATGRVTISANLAFTLLFSTGANAAVSMRHVLGFGAVDMPTDTTATAANQHQNGWYADDPVVDDTGERAGYERAQTRALSGRTKGVTHATRYRRDIVLAYLPAWKVWLEDEGSTHLNEALERLLVSGWGRFRWFPDQTALNTGTDYSLDVESARAMPRNRLSPGTALYSLTLRLLKYV